MNLDIIIPVHNDEDTITDLYNKINDEIIVEKYNVIFIDDGKISFYGTAKEAFSNRDNERLKDFLLKTNK